VYEFGDFRLDCGAFELLHKGSPLRIERKPMELLILFASRQGQLVSRTEIAERLWTSEVFVDTEHGINTAVRKLRHLLRDDAEEPEFIQTVTGMGYRFIAPVSAVASVSSAEPGRLPEASPAERPGTVSHSRRKGTGLYRLRQRSPQVKYTQLTDFTDSAVQPALSPDGHMLAFIRGGETFLTSDQIYVKVLPNGEARRVTDDPRPKYGLAFSPDGSEISYTVLDGSPFSTYRVSSL
jgi:DNA-binding winged helix-turn-helix (wHTH) protein